MWTGLSNINSTATTVVTAATHSVVTMSETQLQYSGLFVAYVLVYTFLYFPNSEYTCFFLLVVIHCFFMAGVYLEKIKFAFKVLPFSLLFWEGTLDLQYVFYLCMILLIVASGLVAMIYRKLHNNNVPVDLGSSRNDMERDNIKRIMIIETLYLFGLCFLMHQDSKKVLSWIERNDMYNILYLTCLGGVIMSCLCVYLANDLGIKTSVLAKQTALQVRGGGHVPINPVF